MSKYRITKELSHCYLNKGVYYYKIQEEKTTGYLWWKKLKWIDVELQKIDFDNFNKNYSIQSKYMIKSYDIEEIQTYLDLYKQYKNGVIYKGYKIYLGIYIYEVNRPLIFYTKKDKIYVSTDLENLKNMLD